MEHHQFGWENQRAKLQVSKTIVFPEEEWGLPRRVMGFSWNLLC